MNKSPRIVKVSDSNFPQDAPTLETTFSELAKNCQIIYETPCEYFCFAKEEGVVLRALKDQPSLEGLIVEVQGIQINTDVVGCIVDIDFNWLAALAVKMQTPILRNAGDGHFYLLSKGVFPTVFRAKQPQSEETK